MSVLVCLHSHGTDSGGLCLRTNSFVHYTDTCVHYLITDGHSTTDAVTVIDPPLGTLPSIVIEHPGLTTAVVLITLVPT